MNLDFASNKLGLGRALTMLAPLCVFGCSVTVDADRTQCERDADCTSRGGAFARTRCIDSSCQVHSKWSCLGAPRQVESLPGPFQVTMQLQEVLTAQPVPGASVQVCRKVDANCEAPESTAVSDENGTFTLSISADFNGFLSVTHGSIVPSLYFFNPPIAGDAVLAPLVTASPASLPVLTSLIGTEQLPDRGLVFMTALDCDGSPASGVSYSLAEADERTMAFYFIGDLPNVTATSTDLDGDGGFVNVRHGTATIAGRVEEDQRDINNISLFAKPGTITFSRMVPP